jgi:hypothetical protein
MCRWSSNSKLVDQVACGGQLSRVDMANDHNVDVRLLLTHGCSMIQDKSTVRKSIWKEQWYYKI